jgi:integrase/recombinase XerD
MLEKLETELKIRGFSPRTVSAYLYHNAKFLTYINKPPEEISSEHVKQYMAYLLSEKGHKATSVNLAMSSLKFLYDEVMEKGIFPAIKLPKQEKKLQVVQRDEESKTSIAHLVDVLLGSARERMRQYQI